MFKFNKFRSGAKASSGYAPSESDNESTRSWSPIMTSKRFVPSKIKNLLRSHDIQTPHHIISDSQELHKNFASSNNDNALTTPTITKKLLRSRHTIDTSLIPAVLDKYDASCSPRSPAVSIASRRSVDIIREHHKVLSRKSWMSGDTATSVPYSGELVSRRKNAWVPYSGEIAKSTWVPYSGEIGKSTSVPYSGEIGKSTLVPLSGEIGKSTLLPYSGEINSRRKSCDVFRPTRFNGDSNCSDPTFMSKRENSGRSSAWDSASDDDLSQSWASFQSQEDDVDEALEFADAEERFIQSHPDYAATSTMDYIRRDQYPKLARHVYMDYASLALSSRFQMEEHMRLVIAEGHMSGANSATAVEYAASSQDRLLKLLSTSNSEYSIVFTTGLKAAYRLVANAYPFQKGSPILLCQDNHDAVSQLMAAAVKAGGKAVLAPLEETDMSMTKANIRPLMKRHIFQPSGSLFVYPAQSSVTGIRHSMHWINKAHKSGWHVLLDASTLLPTGTLDLQKHQPDFVVGSFQNIVGYPSGMGFLLVRRASFLTMHAPNSNAITLIPRVNPTFGQDCHIVAEDESLSKLSFAGLDFGLQHLQSLGLEVINKRVKTLATWMVHKLKGLRQIDPDDWSLVNVYSPYMTENRGNIISFNVLDSAGEVVSPALVLRLAAKHQITLAVGVFNNPGVSNLLGPAKGRVKNVSVFESASDFECLQVSLGPMSNFEDAYRVVQFLCKFRNHDYVSNMVLGKPPKSLESPPKSLESDFHDDQFY